VVNDVEEAVVSVREAEESWRGEMREIRGEVESVRELVPRVSLLFTHSRTPALRNDSQPIVLMSDWRRDWICCKGS
jgi:hypothetical protein